MPELNQYEFSIEVDEYIFERFVKDKVNFAYKKFEDYKKVFPDTRCNFILRDKSETTNQEDKIYFGESSERPAMGAAINNMYNV